MNKEFNIISIFLAALLLLVIGYFLLVHFAFNGLFSITGPVYAKQDLIDNYEERKNEITEVKSYINSITQEDVYINIEFGENRITIFDIENDGVFENNWNLDFKSVKLDSLLSLINWTISDLKLLKEKLDKASCISVSNGNPTTIGWQRSGMGKFSYKVFDQALSDSTINKNNDGCTHVFYKENIVLVYGGGAVGQQCFKS